MPNTNSIVSDVKKSFKSKNGDVITSVSSLVLGESSAKGATFYIRETSEFIDTIKKKPQIQIRFGATSLGKVTPVIVLVKITTEIGHKIYQGWINYHESNDHGKRVTLAIEKDNHLIFAFVGCSGTKEKIFAITTNGALKKQFSEINKTLISAPSWQQFNFESIKAKIESDFKSKEVLWDRLTK